MSVSRPDHDQLQEDSILLTEPLWTVNDVSGFLRLEPETVRQMARNGLLPSIKIGRRMWRFRRTEIQNWLDDQQSTHPIEPTNT